MLQRIAAAFTGACFAHVQINLAIVAHKLGQFLQATLGHAGGCGRTIGIARHPVTGAKGHVTTAGGAMPPDIEITDALAALARFVEVLADLAFQNLDDIRQVLIGRGTGIEE